MHRITNLRYLLADVPKHVQPPQKKPHKVNIKPVKIDFPLPDKVTGIENRLNSKNLFSIPEQFSQKHQPESVIGKNIRLSHLLKDWAKYVDQVVTITGWAREARLAAKDTLVFVKLVDGSNVEPIQVVIEKTIPNWE